jgi:hypothetical protein
MMDESGNDGVAMWSRMQPGLTIAAISVVAWALCDMTHEVVGHIGAAWLVGLKVASLSAKGMATTDLNAPVWALRYLYVAGTLANVGVGALAMLLFDRLERPSLWGCLLFLYGAFGLFGFSYPIISPLLGSGDWAKAIDGLSSPLLWRVGVAAAGVFFYVISVRWVVRSLLRAVSMGVLARRDLGPLIVIGYFTASSIQAAAVFANQITPGLESPWVTALSVILNQNIGLFIALHALQEHLPGEASTPSHLLPASRGWVLAGLLVAALFIGVIGRGLRFDA